MLDKMLAMVLAKKQHVAQSAPEMGLGECLSMLFNNVLKLCCLDLFTKLFSFTNYWHFRTSGSAWFSLLLHVAPYKKTDNGLCAVRGCLEQQPVCSYLRNVQGRAHQEARASRTWAEPFRWR